MLWRRIAASVKRIGGAAAVVTLITAGIGAVPAQAAMTDGFSIKNAIVQDIPGVFAFDWSAEELGRRPQPGEGFEIGINYLLMAKDHWVKQPMTVGDTEVGTCLTEPTGIVCTVDERIEQLAEDATIEGHVETILTSSSKIPGRAAGNGYYSPYITFSFNGKAIDVAIPKGIPETLPKNRDALSVNHPGINEHHDYAGWMLNFIPSALAEKDAATFTQPDGSTVISYTFKVSSSDEFAAEQFQKTPWQLRELPKTPNNGYGYMSALVDTANSPQNDFTLEVSGDNKEKTITVAGPFKPDNKYSLYLPTKLQSEFEPGKGFTFTAALDGYPDTLNLKVGKHKSDIPTNFEVITVKHTSATDIPVPSGGVERGYGELTYDLPGDTKASDYPEWKYRPAGIADNDQSGTVNVEYMYSSNGFRIAVFPVGTTLSFKDKEPQWRSHSYDPDKTTIEPAELTVVAGKTNRFMVTYTMTGRKTYLNVGVKVTGEDRSASYATGKNVEVTYTCTKDGQEIDKGEQTIRAVTHAMDRLGLYEGAECTLKQDPESVPAIDGYVLDTNSSVLEKTVTIQPGMDPIILENHYIRTPE